MDLELNGKRALVTAASRGLGYAAAALLAAEGCMVTINSRNEESIREAAEKMSLETGNKVYGVAADVSQPEATTEMVQEAAGLMGGLDILICNAGGPPSGAFEKLDEAAWRKAVDLTFLSNVWLIKAALPFLKHSAAASVLTVTSYSVKQPIPNLTFSNSLRLATIGLTKSLALELGGQGIRFNSILPGWTETERVGEILSARAEVNQTTADEEMAKQMKESVFNRMASPQEFAKAAVFLVSPAASYMTGVMLPVDGGTLKGTL